MTQEQRRIYLLEKLLVARGERAEIPDDTAAKQPSQELNDVMVKTLK
ncbi:MAG: hypothetical protein IJQ37_03380 [Clostridia bacterium]|nr:hypothetical protein [Clostridia bacterium]